MRGAAAGDYPAAGRSPGPYALIFHQTKTMLPKGFHLVRFCAVLHTDRVIRNIGMVFTFVMRIAPLWPAPSVI